MVCKRKGRERSVIQPSFNFEAPRSRRSDPPSSRRAESEMRRSGALKGQRLIALELVKQFPGRSSKRIGEAWNARQIPARETFAGAG